MDFTVNLWAVLVATAVYFALGAGWYMALSKPWMEAVGFSRAEAPAVPHRAATTCSRSRSPAPSWGPGRQREAGPMNLSWRTPARPPAAAADRGPSRASDGEQDVALVALHVAEQRRQRVAQGAAPEASKTGSPNSPPAAASPSSP